MVDIRDYPGALNAVNQLLNEGKEATLRIEYDRVAVAERARFFKGVYEVGETEPRRNPIQIFLFSHVRIFH